LYEKGKRMIKIKPPQSAMGQYAGGTYWVKETNAYFEWYKNSSYWRVVKEVELKK
jgi:hypothetical protein